MKKIKDLESLHKHKDDLKRRMAGLENKVREDWYELKESIQPARMATEAMDQIVNKVSSSKGSNARLGKRLLFMALSVIVTKVMQAAINKYVR